MKANRVLFWVFLLITTFLIMGNQNEKPKASNDPYAISTQKKSFPIFDEVSVEIFNNSEGKLKIENKCPLPSLIVEKYKGNQFENISDVETKNEELCKGEEYHLIKPKSKTEMSFSFWNAELFGEVGRYRVGFKNPVNEEIVFSNEFEITERGFWGSLWIDVFYQPIYNILIFFIKNSPYHSLGIAIIMLTIAIRVLLLVPNRKAIESQKKMNELQPKLQSIKEKYSANQQKQAEETLKLWKENRVNPFGYCLPILIQFPIMIALYWVVRSGLAPHNEVLIYDFIGGFNISEVNSNFLWMDLRLRNLFVLPLVVGFLQYIQMRYSLLTNKRKKIKKKGKNDLDQTEIMNKMMLYFMPVMVAVFTANLPAGVGLYWGTSTMFGICQQWFVFNKKKSGNTKVKVIETKSTTDKDLNSTSIKPGRSNTKKKNKKIMRQKRPKK